MKKVLIVEDDFNSVFLFTVYLKKILNLSNNDIIVTNGGEESIEIVKKKNRDLKFIIMDIRLIGSMNGFTTTEEILKIRYVPIIVITAQELSNIRELSIKTMCLDFLSKPCSIDDLRICLLNNNLID